MLVVAQGVMLFGGLMGLFLFVYANAFIVKRLVRADRRIGREEVRMEAAQLQAGASTSTAVSTQLALPEPSGRNTEEALYLMYQEQVRRFIDAKIDIMKSTAETQNRILLLQAQAMASTTVHHGPAQIEGAAGGRGGIHYLPAMTAAAGDADEMAVPAKRDVLSVLMEQHEVLRSEARDRLDEIDHQIRTLPGPSMDAWVMAQAHQTIN